MKHEIKIILILITAVILSIITNWLAGEWLTSTALIGDWLKTPTIITGLIIFYFDLVVLLIEYFPLTRSY